MLPNHCDMSVLRGSWLIISFILPLMYSLPAYAQNKHWREIERKPLIKFDWNCASPSAYPKLKYGRHVETALRSEDSAGEMPDRAFAFDLNDDGRPEYFIPLVCGAVGNCTWGVFAQGPIRFLGTVNGQYIFVYKRAGGWPGIITYGHLSAMEGVLDTYTFKKGQYRLSGKGYPIGPEDRTLEIQNIPGRKMPKFLDKARRACKNLGS
jgi:hypothetical protein